MSPLFFFYPNKYGNWKASSYCMGQEMETQLGLNLQENVNRREQIKETTDSAEIPENSFTYTAT